MEKYKNKYRIKSARHPNWDYGSNGLYFITICTQNRTHFFGDIVTDKNGLPSVSLSEIGKIAETEWLKTFEMRPDMNLWMGNFIVMPNHFHAIIGIGDNEFNTQNRDAMHCVSTANMNANTKNKFGPQSKNLASIIRGFKIGVTKNARPINPDFSWQPRYHDHIIRNDLSFHNISNYIEQNALNWEKDKFYD